MLIKDLIGDKYQFTQYIYELACIIQNDTQTLVLCNLLNKYCNYTDAKVQIHSNGKQYHFYHSQKDIYDTELFVSRKKYEKALKELKEKGYISTFSAKTPNNNLIEITFFFINLDLINKSYQEGYKQIHGKEIEIIEPKETIKQTPATKQTTNKQTNLQQQAFTKLKKDFKCGFINEVTYINRLQQITNKN